MSPEICVIDNNKFIFSTEGTTTNILKNKNGNQFSIELPIPKSENISATMCVVRINFEDAFQISISASDPDNNSIIDFTEIAQIKSDVIGFTSHQADLYIPAAYFSKKVRITFLLHYPDHANSIKNIELWYY